MVEWGASPVNLIHWALTLSDPSTRVSVMCVLDSEREVPAPPRSARTRTVQAKWRQAASHVVDETCAQLRAEGLQAEPIFRDGSPHEAVLWATSQRNADLVLATAAFADEFHATTLERMKHMARTSFLFVRSSPDRRRPVLVADDFTDASRHARLLSTFLAERLDVELRVVADGSREAARQRTPKRTLRSELLGTLAPSTAIAESILGIAKEQDAQLIVVGNNRRGSLRRLLFGSVSDDVARHAATNVLVATPQGDEGPSPSF